MKNKLLFVCLSGMLIYGINSARASISEFKTNISADEYCCKKSNTKELTDKYKANPVPCFSAASSQVNIACNGGTTGSATVMPSGGVSPFAYSWAPSGGTAATATGLAAGSYTCTITDATSCSIAKTFTITEPTVLTATTAQVNVTCNGGTNGSANVTPSGGSSPYTYSWAPTGGSSSAATGLLAGSYTCTITDVNSCVLTKVFTITQVAAVTATTAQTNISCNGGSNGSASVVASGGATPYTYSWAPSGGSSATASGLAAGTYTCTITDYNSCLITKVFTITQPATFAATTSQTNVSCNGGSNGTASVIVSGGTSPYTYSWAPSGGTGATASGLAAGTYTCTITDANSCTLNKNVTVTQPTVITASTVQTNIACYGSSTGSASVVPSGGAGAYTYAWTPSGGTASSATGLAAGAYTCTITDANTCTLAKKITLTQLAALVATTSQTNISCNGGSNGTATVAVTGGTSPYTYSWAPSGGAAATATGLLAGSYTCTITDAYSCTLAKNFTVTQPTAITATTSQTNISCNGGSNGSASVSVTGGTSPYTYSWAPSGGTAATATGLSAGSYTSTITDGNGCTLAKNFTVTQPAAIFATTSQTNISCNGGSNGSASVSVTGGTSPYTYSWAPSGGTAATATGLSAGSYTSTITDGNGCTLAKNFTITQPAAIFATTSQTNISCNGGSNGSASVIVTGGISPYTYSWVPSGGTAATATGLSAGSYTSTITDGNGCTLAKNFTVTQPAAIFATTSQTNISCNGGSNGSASVSVTGGISPYTYSWAPSGGTAATATGLSAGSYTCTITDGNGCTLVKNFTVTQPAAIAATTSQTNISCNGGSNGSASVSVTGGTSPYTYSWSPSGGTGATATGLSAGSYTCTITDGNGCTLVKNFTVTQPAAIFATTSQTNISCNGGSNGSASVSVTGGTSPYTYSWSPSGGTGATATNLSAGSYICTIADAGGCSITKNFTINQPAALSLSVTALVKPGCKQSNGSITVEGHGGLAPYTYTWNTSATGAILSGIPAGTYTVVAKDVNGCTLSSVQVVTNPNPPVVTFNYPGKDTVCVKSVAMTLTGGTPAGGAYAGNGVSSGGIFTPANASIGWNVITYSYANSDSCWAVAKDSIYVKDCIPSGVITLSSAAVISIYPNPAFNKLVISYESNSEKLLAVNILSLDGRLISNEKPASIAAKYSKQLDIADYTRGVYFVQFITETDVIIKRIILQ